MPWRFLCSQLLPFYPATCLILTSTSEAQGGGEVPAASSLGHCRQAGLESQLTLQQAEERVTCSPHGFLQKLSPAALWGFLFSQSPMHCGPVTLAPIPSSAIYPISETCREQHGQPASQRLAGIKLAHSLPGLASLSGFSSRAKDGITP